MNINLRGPRRIVCLTEETTGTLYLLGEQDRIVGISGFRLKGEPPGRRFSFIAASSPRRRGRIHRGGGDYWMPRLRGA